MHTALVVAGTMFCLRRQRTAKASPALGTAVCAWREQCRLHDSAVDRMQKRNMMCACAENDLLNIVPLCTLTTAAESWRRPRYRRCPAADSALGEAIPARAERSHQRRGPRAAECRPRPALAFPPRRRTLSGTRAGGGTRRRPRRVHAGPWANDPRPDLQHGLPGSPCGWAIHDRGVPNDTGERRDVNAS